MINKQIFVKLLFLLIIQQSMRNGSAYENADATLKDKLIIDMKKQLYALKQLDHEYLRLLDEVKSAESKYSLLQDDSQRIQNEHKIKSDITRTNISQLRNELDNLKIQIHKYDVSIDDIARQIANLNRVNQNRENQIASQMGINQDLQKNNIDQAEANKSLNQKIQSMKEQRNKCQAQCQRLRKLLDEKINELKGHEKQARHIQSSNHRHQTILQIAMADREELIQGLKSREQLVNNTNRKLDELHKERDNFKQKTNKLQKQCIKSESDLNQVTSDLNNGINKNKQLANRLKNQEKILRGAQGDLDKSRLDLEALTKQNGAIIAEHNGLNTQIDRCILSIIEMEKFNEDLQRDIKMFMDTDQEARKMLNRRDAMAKMLDQVLNTLHKSGEQIAHLR